MIYKSRHFSSFLGFFFSKSRHILAIVLIFSVLPFLLDELRLGAENPVLKSLSFGQFPLVKPFPVVLRRVVADGEARPLGVVVFDIAFYGLFKGAWCFPALFDLELDAELFLDPAVQSFVDGVVRGLSCPGHGADDVRVLDEFVVGDGGVDAALVGVQDGRFRASLEQVDNIRKAVDVLVSGASLFRHFPGEYLLGEDVEVEGDLVVVAVHLEGCHVGDDDLSGAVHRVPGGEDQVGIQVPHLSGLVVYAVLGLRLDAEIPVTLVGVVVADDYLHVDAEVGGCPAVAVGGMFAMDFLDQGDYLFPLVVAG